MTPSTYLEVVVGLVLAPGSDSQAVFTELADAFHELPDATVRDLGFDVGTSEVTMTFTFEGRIAPDDAVRTALTIGRTAFHSAGLDTADDTWELARWSITPSVADQSPSRAPQLA